MAASLATEKEISCIVNCYKENSSIDYIEERKIIEKKLERRYG